VRCETPFSVIKDVILEHAAQFRLIANKTQRDLAHFIISLARGWNENLGSNPVKDRFMGQQVEGRIDSATIYDPYNYLSKLLHTTSELNSGVDHKKRKILLLKISPFILQNLFPVSQQFYGSTM
jgi:hypothetical protein